MAFENLKTHLGQAPILSKPEVGDTLSLYLSVSSSAVSSVITRNLNGTQHPVYYVSKALTDTEARYPAIEKLALALIISARKLRPYFQAHSILVLTDQPLSLVLRKPETSGRLVKWSVELGEFDITYRPRTAIQAQAIADFISEFTTTACCGNPTTPASSPAPIRSTLFVDGTSNLQGCSAGIVLISSGGVTVEYAMRFRFRASNNEAEYEALLVGLRLAKELGAEHIIIHSDSQLVVNQVTDAYQTRKPHITAYVQKVKTILLRYRSHSITQIPRAQNTRADALARLASALDANLTRSIPIEYLSERSIDRHDDTTMAVDAAPTWMTPIWDFLSHGILPQDKVQAKQIQSRATRYTVIDQKLYKRGFSLPLLLCITPDKGLEALREIHEGICGDHAAA
ncbi:unnamed protein product, partial [Prunus brigantina]